MILFPLPLYMLTRQQKRYLANRGYDTGVSPSVRSKIKRRLTDAEKIKIFDAMHRPDRLIYQIADAYRREG